MSKELYNTIALNLKQTKDESAFNLLYQNLYFGLKNYVRNILKNYEPEVIEDIVNMSFARAYEKIDSFNLDYSFTTWLYTIAKNFAFGHIRRQKNMKTIYTDFTLPVMLEDDDAYTESSSHESSLTIEQEEPIFDGQLSQDELLKEAIGYAISELSPLYKDIIKDFHFSELSYKEIAVKYNLHLSTVKTRIHRARLLMQDALRVYRKKMIARGVAHAEDFVYA